MLGKGIIPHVITNDEKGGYEIEIPYEKAEADLKSTELEELKKALHAGQIPEAYVSVIQDMEVEAVCRMKIRKKETYMAARKKCRKRKKDIL